MAKAELPVDEILAEYILGYWDLEQEAHIFPTIKELAVRYKCSADYLYRVSSENKWGTIKAVTQARVKQNRTVEDVRKILSISSTQDARALENIERVHDLAGNYLERLEIELDEMVDVANSRFPDSLKKIAETMKLVNSLSHSIMGEDGRKESLYTDLEKLQEEIYNKVYLESDSDAVENLKDEIEEYNKLRNTAKAKFQLQEERQQNRKKI